MKRRALFLLLSLALLFSLVLPAATAYADDNSSGKGMEISKTAAYNEDGSYTITLEAYATGAKVISDISKDIPTDIILVLDQSGSMEGDIGTVSFSERRNAANKTLYDYRHNGGSANLWHKLADGSYVSVSVTRQQSISYNKITKGRNDDNSEGYTSYWNNRDNLYTYVNGEIKKVIYTRDRTWVWQNWRCKYALEDGTILNENSDGAEHSPKFQNTDDGYLYLAVENANQNVYTYTYTDANGVEQTIDTSTGADTVFSPTLYQRTTSKSGGGSRLAAIKNAATAFVNSVAAKAAGEDDDITTTADNINHRIAVVGYADTDWDYGYNTGVFIGSTLNRYQTDAAGVYSTALQDMSTTNGKNNVTASLNALQASGATRTDYGLIMAKGILDANPVPTGETRNRVVIVFTDGSPTDYNGFQKNVANSAISTANAIKAGGTTVYSIGIFSGADASSAGTEPSGNLDNSSRQLTAACNWFMQKVSSNNGTPRTPSYYLSAGDSASLNNIFQQISDQIETGGSSSTLTEEAVVKDIITPYFELPESTTAKDIKIETFACTGKDAGGEYTWINNNSTMGATASINGDRVDVTGFNFSENYVGTVNENGNITYRGHKLVISFKVLPKAGFLGGNDVDTNTNAGIYENKDAASPVLTFEKPKVNVPIKDITVTAQDKNIYLLGDVTADKLKNGATVKVGDVPLKLGEPNFGLEAWQNEFVDITVDIVDAEEKDVSVRGLTDLKDDTTYKIKVTVSPKTSDPESTIGPKAEAKPGQGNANIYVFKPEVTFKDSVENYGKDVDKTYYETTNKVSTVWKHGTTDAANADMIGTKPALEYTYDPASAKLTTDDLPVKVALVKIDSTDVTGHVTFKHKDCTHSGCEWNDLYAEGNGEAGKAHFIVHVNKIEIIITKIVEGNFGDKLKNFNFAYKIGDVDGGTFTLRNGESTKPAITVPVGAIFTLTEATDGKYSTVFKYGDTQLSSKTVNNGVQVSFTVGKDKNNVTVTNTRNTTPDTGVSLDSLPYIIVLAAVAVAAVVIILRKRRNNDD